jgi:CRP-like cAMP-binding protein
MAQKSVRQRLAEAIINIHNSFGTNSDGTLSVLLSREDFAGIVGTATESAIRVLSQFKKEGLISTHGKKIKIENLDGLKRVE